MDNDTLKFWDAVEELLVIAVQAAREVIELAKKFVEQNLI